jgi:uncharacterized protein YbjQ (UPF0145 family)
VHAQQAVAADWQCRLCGTANNVTTEFCVQCGADSRGANRIPHTEPDSQPILIVTMNEIPGYQITEVHGDVFGLVVRARNYFSNLGAQFMTVAGGEVTGYTKLLTDSRNQARERMWREARARGANAIVAMRFDCNEIGGIMSEVAAYGTAVTVEQDAAPATVTHRPVTMAPPLAMSGPPSRRHPPQPPSPLGDVPVVSDAVCRRRSG